MKDELDDIKKEFKRLHDVVKSNPEISEELTEEHKKLQAEHLKFFEEQIIQDKKFIEETNDLLAKQAREIEKFNIVESCIKDHRIFLEEHHNRLRSGQIKSCFFQEDVVAPIVKISTQFFLRIFNFSQTAFDQFKKNNYAGLILVRANIENLILFYFYIRTLEKYIDAGEWLKIVKLNHRIQYVKSASSMSEFDRIFQMDYMDYVKALTSTDSNDSKTIHINDALKVFFNDMKNKYIFNFNDAIKSDIFKKIQFIELNSQIFYNENNYFMLCEIVHPVAISRKPYPLDKDPNSSRHIFANAHRQSPFSTSLFFYGISLYEKLKKINDPLIEKNLKDSINQLVQNYSKKSMNEVIKNPAFNKTSDLFKKYLINKFKKFEL